MIPSGISLGRDICPDWYAHLSACHCGQLRAGQRGHRKGTCWCGPSRGWTAAATGRPWELGAGEDPVRRAQGSEQRWRGARESARSPVQSLWLLDVHRGGRAASGLRVPPLPGGPGGKPGGRKAPCDWGELGEDHEVQVCGSGCGPGPALPPGALGPRLWREAPLPLASQESILGGEGAGGAGAGLCAL